MSPSIRSRPVRRITPFPSDDPHPEHRVAVAPPTRSTDSAPAGDPPVLNLAAFLVATALGFVLSRMRRRPRPARPARGAHPGPTPRRPADPRPASPAPSPRPGPLAAPPPARTHSGLTPSELQRAALAELLRSARRHGDHVQLDHRAVLRMHPDDADLVAREQSWFVPGIRDALETAAATNHWRIAGPIDIGVRADPDRRPGLPRLDRPADAAAPPSGDVHLVLTRSDTGTAHRLTAGSASIGRAEERDLRVDDPRVSRLHARIDASGGTWMLVDLGSANGTVLDGRSLTPNHPVALHDGADIGVGPVRLHVEITSPAPAPSTSAPGTPALSDAERAALAHRLLPPHPEVRR